MRIASPHRLRNRHLHVAAIGNMMAKHFQLGFQAGHAQRRRPHIHAAPLLSQVQRHSDHLNLLRRALPRTRRAPLPWLLRAVGHIGLGRADAQLLAQLGVHLGEDVLVLLEEVRVFSRPWPMRSPE
jgi:hypothetical protein